MSRQTRSPVRRWVLEAEIALVLYVNVTAGVWQGLVVALVVSGLYYATVRRVIRT